MALRTALLSVSDKTGLLDFARGLVELGTNLLSTGGTYRSLHEAGITVKTVESYTESPEVMDGRVKTLHPRVHGGLLARAGKDDDDLRRIGGVFIDLVAVNLYPFEKTLQKPGASFEELIGECGPYERSITKTAIAYKGSVRGFAGVTPRRQDLTGFLDLTEEVHEAPFTRVTLYTKRLWVHRFVVDSLDQLDAAFVNRMAEAYAVGQGAHR